MNPFVKALGSLITTLRKAMLSLSIIGFVVMVWPCAFADRQEGRPVRHFLAVVLLLVWSAALPAGAALFYMGLFS
jgi:hypothetical protein